jgi:nucleoside-diphosphate-sugar epimerase
MEGFNMRIFISGGLGFIGSHLSEKLDRAGHEIHIFDRLRISKERYYRGDLNDYYSLENAFGKAKPQLVIHLGGMVSRKECEETPDMAIATNAGGTFHVCALSLKHGARLIYAGSSEEYGTALGSERVVDEATPFGEPTSIYSMTKRMAEEIVRYFAHFKGLKASTIRFFMLYGPGEEPTDYRSALVRFTYKALTNRPLIVHKGTERAWCYIDDATDAIKLIVERKQEEKYEDFNIGRSEPIPTELLADKIIKICRSSSEIKKVPVESTVIPVKRASFRKVKDLLGWEAKKPIDEGLKEVVKWIKQYIKDEGHQSHPDV